MSLSKELRTWFGNIGGDIWGGLITTFALLPETIGFMLAVGVPPYIGLYTCICLTVVMAFAGGRPGVITAGAGSTAMILVNMVATHWDTHPEYIFAAVVLAGIIQIILGIVKIGNLVKYLPASVMNGFVNGLAILIFISQVKLILRDIASILEMLILVAVGLAIIICMPMLGKKIRIFRRIPSSLVVLILMTLYVFLFKRPVLTISDLGSITPSFTYIGSVIKSFGNIFTLECFANIWSVGLSIALIGIIESMLTCRVFTEETATQDQEDLNRECRGLGVGNVICGLLGAMPGCAMIGQTKVNMNSGGRGRLSSLTAGIVLCILLFFVNPVLGVIPIAALVAIMLKACYDTFAWDSVTKCLKYPVRDTMTMILTVLIVVYTSNLAFGVGAGIALYAALYGILYFLKMKHRPELPICFAILLACASTAALMMTFMYSSVYALYGAICGIVSVAIASLPRDWTRCGRGVKIICTMVMIMSGILGAVQIVLMYVM